MNFHLCAFTQQRAAAAHVRLTQWYGCSHRFNSTRFRSIVAASLLFTDSSSSVLTRYMKVGTQQSSPLVLPPFFVSFPPFSLFKVTHLSRLSFLSPFTRSQISASHYIMTILHITPSHLAHPPPITEMHQMKLTLTHPFLFYLSQTVYANCTQYHPPPH